MMAGMTTWGTKPSDCGHDHGANDRMAAALGDSFRFVMDLYDQGFVMDQGVAGGLAIVVLEHTAACPEATMTAGRELEASTGYRPGGGGAASPEPTNSKEGELPLDPVAKCHCWNVARDGHAPGCPQGKKPTL